MSRNLMIRLLSVLLAASLLTAQTKFDVASIKDYKGPRDGPRDVRRTYGPQGVNFILPLLAVVGEAYNFLGGRIVWPPAAADETLQGKFRDGYEIVANTDHHVTKDELRWMLQSLLADRFQLKVHKETKSTPVYKLVVAKGGPKLEEGESGGETTFSSGPDAFVFRNAEMTRLAGYFTSRLDRLVVDETGPKGLYNFSVKTPEDLRLNPGAKQDSGTMNAPTAATYKEALKALGLELVAGTAQVEFLIIDHVERPTQN